MTQQERSPVLSKQTRRGALFVLPLLLAALVLLLALALPAAAKNNKILPAAAQSSQVFPGVIPLPDGWQPEGIAAGRGTSFYVGSLANGGVYGGDLRTGEGEIVVPAQQGRVAVGLDVDLRSNTIYVAGGGPALAPVPGGGYVYDLETGQEVAAYDFDGLFVNDVIVTRDAAYFTDSGKPMLYKVALGPRGEPLDPAAFEVIPLGSGFDFAPGAFNANGIVATPDGRTLIVVNTSFGRLYKVNALTGEAVQIDLGGDSLPNGDGLVLAGQRLYVVQNQLNQIGIVDLDPSLTSGVVSSNPLTSPEFEIPTTAAKFGSTIYAVNARFGVPPTPDTEYTVVGVPAR